MEALPSLLKGDEAMAVWVKLNEKWHIGIKCERADWPSLALKEKPTHDDGKKHILIFCPNTSCFVWADIVHIQPINEFPQPNEYKTHLKGLETSNDLTAARIFLLQKLTIEMLTIVDHLHTNALVEGSRNVLVWQQFAMEASQCYGYSHLGRMLLALKNRIVAQYINVNWILHYNNSWVKRCQNTNDVVSVELLKEELFDSIMWNDANTLWGAQPQQRFTSEWITWKYDVERWFSSYSPFTSMENDIVDQASHDQAHGKRAKLMVRRADTHATLVKNMCFEHAASVENGIGISTNQETMQALVPVVEPQIINWNELVVEPLQTIAEHGESSTHKNQQYCAAYLPAKERQCAKLAISGNKYCCYHSPTRDGKPKKLLTPFCRGITIAGNTCKHRSTPGFSYCKKHWNQDEVNGNPSSSHRAVKRRSNRKLKRKSGICKEIVPVDVEIPLQEVHGDYLLEGDDLSGNYVYSDEPLECIGKPDEDNEVEACLEEPRWHFLYCEMHLPIWLRNATDQTIKIIPKVVFIDLLNECRCLKEKVHLHKACALYYKLIRSILSGKNYVPKEVELQWALNEASKDKGVEEFFHKLINIERDRMESVWGFNGGSDRFLEGPSHIPSTNNDSGNGDERVIKCRICSDKFPDEEALGSHWMGNHQEESQWLFTSYACAICFDSFTNKQMLVKHVSDRHHVQFVEQCSLVQCIPCGIHLGNMEKLWVHVLSAHTDELTQSIAPMRLTLPKSYQVNEAINSQKLSGSTKFTCKICNLEFKMLPDLGRHHQAAHMERNQDGRGSGKKTGINSQTLRLKSSRVSRPSFKKVAAQESKRKSRANANSKRQIHQ